MARRIKAPGIEINEIDRSAYSDASDNSKIGTAALIYGFADKGDDYDVKRVYTMEQFTNTYGTPSTEAERYFYNAAYEVMDQGGVLYTSKLPYDNTVLDMVSYTQYKIDDSVTPVFSPFEIASQKIFSNDIQKSLFEFLLFPGKDYQNIMPILDEYAASYGTPVTLTPDTNETVANKYTVMEREHMDMSDPLEILDRMGIKSSAIDSLFRYIEEHVNFSHYAKSIFSELFYDTDGLARNKSVCILDEIYKGNYEYIHEVKGLKDFDINGNREILDEIKNTITDNIKGEKYDGIIGIVESFGKSVTIRDYRRFYEQLVSDIENYTENTDKDFMLGILNSFSNINYLTEMKYTEIPMIDSTMTSYMTITDCGKEGTGLLSYDFLDKYITGMTRVKKNTITICDMTRTKYTEDDREKEYIGIMPVIVSPANAMYYQQLFEKTDDILSDYNVLGYLRNVKTTQEDGLPIDLDFINADTSNLSVIGFTNAFGSEQGITAHDYTISQQAAERFPTVRVINGRLERTYTKQIGVVVFKLYKDYTSDNKIGMIPVEAFVGSLDRNFTDPVSGQKLFIDDTINQNSEYIRFFSNMEFTRDTDTKKTEIDKARFFVTSNQCATSLGFYKKDTRKLISVDKSIMNALNRTFLNIEDKNKLDVDIICDAGVSNIGQFIASTQPKGPKGEFINDPMKRIGYFDLTAENAYLFRLENEENVKVWKTIINKFDDFCKNVRKDCMFIADGPRPMVLEGNEKVVRRTRPRNTIRENILPKMKYISGIFNSSYSAGYLNWMYSRDNSNGSYIWIPPSIKVMGVYMYTDLYSNYWNAPAGLNRGVVRGVFDTSFNPTNEEAWDIYENTWNYAVNYPTGGIVIEGQKTFQTNKTALDRVNVRRLMLGLEKITANTAKYYNYEQNTEWMRSRFKDSVSNYLEHVKTYGGISDYVVVCDDRNNTIQTIENNELHCTIAVKPIKAIEFIILNFVCTNQSANVTEIAESEL